MNPEAIHELKTPGYEVTEPVIGLAYGKGHFEEVPIHMLYARDDPASATLRFFPDSEHPKDWQFSRRTLARGFFEPHGDGDIRVEPWEETTVLVHLNPRNGPQSRVVLPRDTVQSFLDRAYKEVPARNEEEMIVGALDAWLSENMPVIPVPAASTATVEEIPV